MKIRTYFWEDRVVGKLGYIYHTYVKKGPKVFRVGNAGDIYARYLIEDLYGASVANLKDEGRRQLFIGSISHIAKPHDLICGVGTKGEPFREKATDSVRVWGVRGPITFDAFKAAGYDVSDVRFQYDPGLMVKFTVDPNAFEQAKKNISFIPHYREKTKYQGKLPKEMTLIDIDDCPHSVAKKILQSKIVYSSSLHGIIFSHSLGVPCVFVSPQSNEPLLKFEDYFMSVGIGMPKPLRSIDEANYTRDSDSPADVSIKREDFVFPDLDYLKEHGYCT